MLKSDFEHYILYKYLYQSYLKSCLCWFFFFFFFCLKDNPEPTKCLGIFGLSLYTQERDLREVFGRFGPLEDVQVVYDRQVSLSLCLSLSLSLSLSEWNDWANKFKYEQLWFNMLYTRKISPKSLIWEFKTGW